MKAGKWQACLVLAVCCLICGCSQSEAGKPSDDSRQVPGNQEEMEETETEEAEETEAEEAEETEAEEAKETEAEEAEETDAEETEETEAEEAEETDAEKTGEKNMKEMVLYTTARVNLRAAATTESDVLKVLPCNTEVRAAEYADGWYRVAYD